MEKQVNQSGQIVASAVKREARAIKASHTEICVRDAVANDAAALSKIYNHYVLNTSVTFEEMVVSNSEMEQRVEAIQDSSLPWLIAERGGSVAGYAYASSWRTRVAYQFSVELSVYLDPCCTGSGIGSVLYAVLLARLKGRGVHAVIGGIALPNKVCVALHERFGFKKVAHFEQVGFKFNDWIDVGYWQKHF